MREDEVQKQDKEALLSMILLILERAPRQGAKEDNPEGVRWIAISDTFARLLADRIREQLNPTEERVVSA